MPVPFLAQKYPKKKKTKEEKKCNLSKNEPLQMAIPYKNQAIPLGIRFLLFGRVGAYNLS